MKAEKWDSLFDLWLGSTRGRRIRVGPPNAFSHHFRTCIDAISNTAYVQIGIGDEKQSVRLYGLAESQQGYFASGQAVACSLSRVGRWAIRSLGALVAQSPRRFPRGGFAPDRSGAFRSFRSDAGPDPHDRSARLPAEFGHPRDSGPSPRRTGGG